MLGHDAICAELIQDGRLHRPLDLTAQMEEAYYLILNPQAEDIPGALEFADWLTNEVEADPHLGRDATQA